MKPLVGVAIAGLVCCSLAGCGQGGAASTLGGAIITPTVDADLQAAMPQVLGPAQSYSVTITGLDTTGHANEVDVTGIDVHPPGGPVISAMTAQMLDVNFNDSSHQITHVGAINLNLTVTASDLTNFVQNDKGIPNTTITLTSPDQLGVTGNPTVPNFGTLSVVIQGHVVPDQHDIDYILDNVQANNAQVTDQNELTAISTLYNPLVDLSSIPAHPIITAISVANNTMGLQATGSFP